MHTTEAYAEPVELSPHPRATYFKIHFSIILPSVPRFLK